jgi:hypothetical protein
MAGRDRIVRQTAFRMTPELKMIVQCYQNDRNLPSFNAAVTELLESALSQWYSVHPGVDNTVMTPL